MTVTNLFRCTCARQTGMLIDTQDYYPLVDGGYTTFMLFRCINCHKVYGFPEENLDIALTDGTRETKNSLNNILNSKQNNNNNIIPFRPLG